MAISLSFVSRLRFSALSSKYRGDALNGDADVVGFAGVDKADEVEEEVEDEVEVVWKEAASSLTKCSQSDRIKPFLDDGGALWLLLTPGLFNLPQLLLLLPLGLFSISLNILFRLFQYSLPLMIRSTGL